MQKKIATIGKLFIISLCSIGLINLSGCTNNKVEEQTNDSETTTEDTMKTGNDEKSDEETSKEVAHQYLH